jgi:hypothetical protein
MTKVGLYAIGKSTTLESNKSHFPLSAITDRLDARNPLTGSGTPVLPPPTSPQCGILGMLYIRHVVLDHPVSRG